RQLNDGGLRGAVDVGPQAGPEARYAGRADDRARTLPLHHRRRVLHPEEDAAEEHADGLVESLGGHVLDLAAHARVAGIVEDAVELAEALAGLVNRRLDIRLAADVGVHVSGARAKLASEPPSAVVVKVGHDHRR